MKGSQGRNLEAEAEAEDMEECLFTGLPPMACLACFLVYLRTTHSRLGPLTLVINQEIYNSLPYRLVW